MYAPPPEYGCACPHCGGNIQVVNTIPGHEYRIRYVGCRECGYRPEENTWTVPIAHSPRRRSLKRLNIRRRD